LYFKIFYPIKNRYVVEGLYADNFSNGSKASRCLSLGFSYRFINAEKYEGQLKAFSTSAGTTINVAKKSPFIKLSDTVVDVDGNKYTSLALGGQVWMAENLVVTRYNDGSSIQDMSKDISENGRKYTWTAVNHERKLCPAGWHVPSRNDWISLINSLGGMEVAGNELEGEFTSEGKVSTWWTSTEKDSFNAHCIYFKNQSTGLVFTISQKTNGFTVRCLRDY